MTVSQLVIPCYNEAQRLRPALFQRFVQRHPQFRILFVDDGSSDATPAILADLIQNDPPHLGCLTLARNAGKAEAVRQGILHAIEDRPAFVGYWDADLATPLEAACAFLTIFEARPGLALVMGARVKLLGRQIRRHIWRHYAGRVFATLASQVLNLAVYDTQCGAKMFRTGPHLASIFSRPFISRWVFDAEMIARLGCCMPENAAPQLDRLIYEYPLEQWIDYGPSKVTGVDFIASAYDLFRIYRRYGRGGQ